MDEDKFEDLSMQEAGEQLDEDEFKEYCQWKEKQLHEQMQDNMTASAARRSEMAQKFIKAGGEHKIAEITVILDEDEEFDLRIDLSKLDDMVSEISELEDKGFDEGDVNAEQMNEMKGTVIDMLSEMVIDEWADEEMWIQFAAENGIMTLRHVAAQIFAAIEQDMRSIQNFRKK